MDIYGPPTKALGDCWAFINMLCHKSIQSKEAISCSKFASNPVNRMHGKKISAETKLKEILSDLDYGEARIKFVDDMSTTFVPVEVCFKSPYLPTKVKWTGGKSIVHQLINGQQPANCPRCPPKHHHDAIMNWVSNHENKRLGLPMSLEECIQAAAGAALFIGMDSGMSHVCHSLGVPVILYDWSRLDEFHHEKKFSRFKTADEAIGIMQGIMAQIPSP